jgi:3-deoxy-7-phosphoheptulonate synthase
MIVVMKTGATEDEIRQVVNSLTRAGWGHHLVRGVERTIIGAIGVLDEEKAAVAELLSRLSGVERVVPISRPYKMVSLEFTRERSTVEVGGVIFGGERVPVIAGPCAVENLQMLLETARAAKAAGAACLRGGAFKPRTSPYDFQGLGEEGLRYLAQAREETGLPIVTEVTDVRQVALVARYADCLQIGTRNMQNFDLLREVGQTGKPVVVKRGWAATVDEWLKAAEYVASSGNLNILLCERGIRTFATETRNTLDISAIPLAKALSHLPVIVDPSHAVGRWELVLPMALASIAAGADGVMVEIHPRPLEALSDGPQSLTLEVFADTMQRVRAVAQAVGRTV